MPSQKLEDQAATAALYVTRGERERQSKTNYPLDDHNKLSSAGAAASLKYAEPRDLPSFPSVGLTNMDSSAGAAASLANAHQKTFEYWKPDPSASANKAAMLAKDYKPPPLWHPEMSAAGSKAALLAAKEGGNVNIWQPEPTDAGHSAAVLAMREKGLSPQIYKGVNADGNRRALLAATGAMSGSRRRAGSLPVVNPSYPDSANSAANALGAATFASKQSNRGGPARNDASNAINAGKIHSAAVTNLSREMYTSHPPVAPEVEEKNREAGLRAAAMSMAKQMYDIQQKAINQAAIDLEKSESVHAAAHVHNRQGSVTSAAGSQQAIPQYANLQEAAQKLAAERLAKLHDEHAEYRNYYGATAPQQSRLSMRGRPRRRASSDGQIKDSDDVRSKQIRSEMSLFNDKIAQVDAKKRQKDREALMAAAQRNVRASMHGMDEKFYADTGKASPAMVDDWEAKANARAEADSKARMVNHGRVNIGGGKYLDQSEIDAIAAARVQPTLDEITEKAEKQRARDEQVRLAQQERERLATEKAQDEKLRSSKTKDEWKRFRDEEKREARAKKEEEKAKKAEDKRVREEEKRKAKEASASSKTKAILPTERPVTATEPPVLAPIPKVEPMSAEEPEEEPVSADEPEQELTSEEESESPEVPVSTVTTTGEPVGLGRIATQDTTATSSSLSPAELVAARVFSAPTDNEEPLTSGVAPPIPAPNTGDVSETMPPTLSTESAKAVPSANAAEPAKPIKSLADETVQTGTTETTITGPPSSSKDTKSDSRVSSWLKSKLSLGTSTKKPIKSDLTKESALDSSTNTSTSPRNTLATSAASAPNIPTTNPTENTSSGPSSVREVTMAGRGTIQLPPIISTTATNPVDEELGAPLSLHSSHSRSSISSLSSDEDTRQERRGRSALRREETGSARSEDEFEEAQDHFDEGGLEPPPELRGGRAGMGIVAGSPVRETRFSEDL